MAGKNRQRMRSGKRGQGRSRPRAAKLEFEPKYEDDLWEIVDGMLE